MDIQTNGKFLANSKNVWRLKVLLFVPGKESSQRSTHSFLNAFYSSRFIGLFSFKDVSGKNEPGAWILDWSSSNGFFSWILGRHFSELNVDVDVIWFLCETKKLKLFVPFERFGRRLDRSCVRSFSARGSFRGMIRWWSENCFFYSGPIFCICICSFLKKVQK